MSEKKIEKAQELLREHGSSIKVTGKDSIGMATAIRKFQKDSGLPVTGVLDDDTWKKLNGSKTLLQRLMFWKK